MRKLVFFLTIYLFAVQINAQNGTDAIRYSLLPNGTGTARSMGIGGAIGALGADFAAIGVNPAGIANYRTSEFVFSLGYNTIAVKSKLEGDEKNTAIAERSAKFNLNNIGFVGSRRPSSGNWTTANWAIGINRLANYGNSFYFDGVSKGSIINRFQEKANVALSKSSGLDGFEEGLAEEANAIYKSNLINTYASDFDGNQSVLINKTQQGAINGRANEVVLSYGANYKEKIMIGATIGIPFISFNENKTYEESDKISTNGDKLEDVPYFKYLSFKENLTQNGSGLNAKLGIIVRPTQRLRLGAAVHSPTIYSLTDNFSTEFTYDYVDGGGSASTTAKSPDGSFDYVLRTPMKLIGSAAYLFGKKGFISADVDYIDYSTMNFEFDSDKATAIKVNQSITDNYNATVNLRVGAEYVMDIFRFRAGLSTLGLPVKDVENKSYFSNATKIYTLGAGIRENKFYADLAYQISQSNTNDKPYLVADKYSQPLVNKSRNQGQLVATIGFKF
jgi:hypothetical protein